MPLRRRFLTLPLLLAPAVTGLRAAHAQPVAQGPQTLVASTLGGEVVDLQRLRGSVVLVFVWSSNCPVCLSKLPELRRNLEGWRGKPFVILALNQDRTADDLRNYERLTEKATKPGNQFKHLWRNAPGHRDSFGELPSNMPTTMVFAKDGTLKQSVRGRVPAELWDDIAELVLG